MQQESKVVEEGIPIDRYTPWGRLVDRSIQIENHELIPGREEVFLLQGRPSSLGYALPWGWENVFLPHRQDPSALGP